MGDSNLPGENETNDDHSTIPGPEKDRHVNRRIFARLCLSLTWFTLVPVATPPASAAVAITDYMVLSAGRGIAGATHPYSTSSSNTTLNKIGGTDTDWAQGTHSGTTSASGYLQLGSTGTNTNGDTTYQATGTWTSPVIDSATTATDSMYGYYDTAEASAIGGLTGNIAVGKATTQNTTVTGYPSTNGNDGDTSTFFQTSTGPAAWRIDLSSTTTVKGVRLWNRPDCCQANATGLYVITSPSLLTVSQSPTLASFTNQSGAVAELISGQIGFPTTYMFAAPRSVQSIVVFQPAEAPLALGEVEVLATANPTPGTTSYQVALSDSPDGPWDYVGVDGTSGTTMTMTTYSYPMTPYGTDRRRYRRVRVTLSGDGTSTPRFWYIADLGALAKPARTSGGSYALTGRRLGSDSSYVWVAKLRLPVAFAGKPVKIIPDPASSWVNTAHASQTIHLSTDRVVPLVYAPCCSNTLATAVFTADETTATSVATSELTGTTYLDGDQAAVSISITGGSDMPSFTGTFTVRVLASPSLVIEIPITFTI